MKTLEPLNVARLSNLEFGQHTKSIHKNISVLGGAESIITDSVLISYLANIDSNITIYDKAIKQIAKSDETVKIEASDKLRDTSVTAAIRYLSVFELSDIEAEQLAFASLDTLFSVYKGIQNWNYEEETNGIDNLTTDLTGTKYKPHVDTIGLTRYVTRIKLANDAFKLVFEKRTQEVSSKEVYDVKAIRNELKTIYTDAVDYILSMAKAKNTDEYNQTLNVVNTVRKYYSDTLAKRKSGKNGDEVSPIPPII